MAEHFVIETTEIVDWYLDFLQAHYPDYRLFELSNRRIPNNVNVVDIHPLALELGQVLSATDADDYQSALPCVGVELQSETETAHRLGAGQSTYEVAKAWLDGIKALPLKDRYTDGAYITDTTLGIIEGTLAGLSGEKLWAEKIDVLTEAVVVISIWSDDPQVTRLLYKITKALVIRSRKELSRKGIATTISAQTGLYNFDFGRKLFGAEITVTPILMMRLLSVDVTSPTSTVQHGEETYPVNAKTTVGSVMIGPEFQGIGE